jgi:hypothetical protein
MFPLPDELMSFLALALYGRELARKDVAIQAKRHRAELHGGGGFLLEWG